MLKTLFKVILAFIIFFPALSFGPITLQFIALLHFAILLLFFIYILQAIKNGTIEYRKLTLNWFFAIFALYITFQLYSGVSQNPYRTLSALKTCLIYFALFFAVTNTITSRRELDAVILQIALAGFLASVAAILQVVIAQTGGAFWLRHISPRDYTFGTALHPNRFACYISMAIFLTVGTLLASASRVKAKFPRPFSRRSLSVFLNSILNGKNLFLFFALTTIIIALILSRSRAGIFGFAAIAIIFIYAVSYRQYSRKIVYSIILTIFVLFLLLNWISSPGVQKELETAFYQQRSYAGRTGMYLDAARMFNDYSLYGVGLGTFSDIFRSYRTGLDTGYMPYTFSDILQFLCEAGAVGFFLMLIPLAFFFLKFKRRIWNTSSKFKFFIGMGIFCAFLYLGLHSLIAPNLWLSSIVSLSVLFLAIASLIMHYNPLMGEKDISVRTGKILLVKGKKTKVFAYILSGTIFLYLSFVVLRPYIVYKMILKTPSVPAFKRAIFLDPENASLYFHYSRFIVWQYKIGGVSDKSLAYQDAKQSMEKAVSLNPYNTDYVIADSELEGWAGNYEKALFLFKKASLMEPNNPWVQMRCAYEFFQEGLREENPDKKGLLLKKGLVYYNKARLLGRLTLKSVIKNRILYRLFTALLEEEGIRIK